MSLPLSLCGRAWTSRGAGPGQGRWAAGSLEDLSRGWGGSHMATVSRTLRPGPGPQVSGSSARATVVSAGLSPSTDSLVGAGGPWDGRGPPVTRCQPCPCTPQLFQIDTPGCVEVVRERKAWPPALLQAGAWDPPPLQVRTEGECPAPQAPASLPSQPVGQ